MIAIFPKRQHCLCSFLKKGEICVMFYQLENFRKYCKNAMCFKDIENAMLNIKFSLPL